MSGRITAPKNPQDAWTVAGIVRYSIRESYKKTAPNPESRYFFFNFEALMTRGICLRRQARCGCCEDQGTPSGGQLVLGKMKHHLCHGWRPNKKHVEKEEKTGEKKLNHGKSKRGRNTYSQYQTFQAVFFGNNDSDMQSPTKKTPFSFSPSRIAGAADMFLSTF